MIAVKPEVFLVGYPEFFSAAAYKQASFEECKQWCLSKKVIAVDTETTDLNHQTAKLITIQLGDSETQWVLYMANTRPSQLLWIQDILESFDILKIFWNASYDLKIFKTSYEWDVNNVYDGMLAEIIINCGYEGTGLYTLQSAVTKYCQVHLDKEIRKEFLTGNKILSESAILYAAKDVQYLHTIRKQQLIRLEELELLRVNELEQAALHAFVEMELNGIKIDATKWKNILNDIQKDINDRYSSLKNIVLSNPECVKKYHIQGDLFNPALSAININWNSSLQVRKVLEYFGIKVDSVKEQVLSAFRHKVPLVKTYVELKKLTKLSNSFGITLLNHISEITGRVHPSFWQIKRTGRVSCSNPNLQQIPARSALGKKMRECFIPETGNKFVGGDYNALELRIIAEGSKDPVWLDAFNKEEDLHSKIAVKLFNISEAEVKTYTTFNPDITYRDLIKTINYGLAYGMSEYKLSDTMGIPVNDAKKLIKDYFKTVPRVKDFLDNLAEYGVRHGFIRTFKPYRRIRWFPQWQTMMSASKRDRFVIQGEIERKAKNAPIQGGNADLVKQALVDLKAEIKKNSWPVMLILQVHDEIISECPEAETKAWQPVMQQIMENAGKTVLQTVPCVVECKIMDYWLK